MGSEIDSFPEAQFQGHAFGPTQGGQTDAIPRGETQNLPSESSFINKG